jgi:F-type H+-transporting ATPase subunit delta
MRGASRASLAEATERLSAAMAAGDQAAAARLGDELFAVTALLDGDAGLRRALSDPSRAPRAKAGLAAALLRGKISGPALELVTTLVSGHWSAPGDLPDAAEQLAVTALAQAADAAGQLDDLEDELFRFGRVVEANAALRAALTSARLPASRRLELVGALLGRKVTKPTLRLVSEAVAHPRGRSLEGSLQSYARLAAAHRERLIAEVRVAVPLTAGQRRRLAAALRSAYGLQVHLNVVLDPDVLGGMSVRIGDELIDGSIASRLAELRRRLAA